MIRWYKWRVPVGNWVRLDCVCKYLALILFLASMAFSADCSFRMPLPSLDPADSLPNYHRLGN